jgi:hypothetical protein
VDEDVTFRALELQQRFFALMDEANRPDVVYDEGGPAWGNTYTGAEDPQLNAEVEAAGQEYEEYLRLRRSELEKYSYWRDQLTILDEAEPRARSVDSDPAEQRRADRTRRAQESSASSPPASRGTGRPRGLSR